MYNKNDTENIFSKSPMPNQHHIINIGRGPKKLVDFLNKGPKKLILEIDD